MIADLVLFAADLTDRATFEEPTRLPDGITDVWVSGTPVLRDATLTGARPGHVLVRHSE